MLAAISIPTLLLLASVAAAQDETPSVATSPFVSPTPESEAIFTIQTSADVDPWSCYMNCVQPPCPPCTGSMVSVPPVTEETESVGSVGPVPMPSATDVSIPPVTDSVVTTPVPLPSPIDVSIPPQESSGVMSIPAGETPLSTGSLDTPATTPSSSATGSSLPEQTTNAAAPLALGHDLPIVIAIAGALALL
ncbi:hypothetical protein G6011_00652 [Alternaria panax]|uniref:Uncharacterized protein n=1 Tax=Alternaria panax TaxID=48097 RepID=A0AAD4NTU6_9PLEO|nr:hypothetical protein G6011_00652 [Alternaria panax]